MLQNINCLAQACDRLNIRYEFLDKEQNFVRINLLDKWSYFQLNKTPFNSEVVFAICRDKMHSYQLLSPLITMPQTHSFLDWNIDAPYRRYLEHPDESAVVEQIEQSLTYPLVMKKNQGALGEHVFLCEHRKQLVTALNTIFDRACKDYDYLALAQQYVPTKAEYRLVCAFGSPLLAYQRGEGGTFNKKYWLQGQQALLVESQPTIQNLFQLIKPAFNVIDIGFAGFDIIEDYDERLYLIEINSSPRFEHLVESSGQDCVVDMYEKALKLYQQTTAH